MNIKLDHLNKACETAQKYYKALYEREKTHEATKTDNKKWQRYLTEWARKYEPLRLKLIKVLNVYSPDLKSLAEAEPSRCLDLSHYDVDLWTKAISISGEDWHKVQNIARALEVLRDRKDREYQETPGAGGGDKPAYQFKVEGKNVWCNGKRPFEAQPRISAILEELINNPEGEVKMKCLETVSGLTRDSVRDTVRDMVAWLNNTFKIDTKKLDKMFEPIRGRNRKYIAYTYHPDIS